MANGKPLYMRTPTGIIRYDNNFTDNEAYKVNELAILGIRGEAEDLNTILSEDKYHHKYFVITKDCIGLERADNTPDREKNVLSATKLTTGRNIRIGLTTKLFDGTKDLSWDIASEIGALPLTGGTMTGEINRTKFSSGDTGIKYTGTTGATGIKLSNFSSGLDVSYGKSQYGAYFTATAESATGILIDSQKASSVGIGITLDNSATGININLVGTTHQSSTTGINISKCDTSIVIGGSNDTNGIGIQSYKPIKISTSSGRGYINLSAEYINTASLLEITPDYIGGKANYTDISFAWSLNSKNSFDILNTDYLIQYKKYQSSKATGTIIANKYVKSDYFEGPAKMLRNSKNNKKNIEVGYYDGTTISSKYIDSVAVYSTESTEPKSIVNASKYEFAKWISDAIYPVGSIYISTDDTYPGVFLAGEWELYSKGKTLVGIDEKDTDFDTVEKTGGRKDAILPPHNHNVNIDCTTGIESNGHTHIQQGTFTSTSESNTHKHDISTGTVLIGQSTTTHTHTQQGYFTTGIESASHTHTVAANTGGRSAAHNHGSPYANFQFIYYNNPTSEIIDSQGKMADGDGGGRIMYNVGGQGSVGSNIATAAEAGDHWHYFAATSSGVSSNHTHSFSLSGNTSTESSTHNHGGELKGNTDTETSEHSHNVTISGITQGESSTHTHTVNVATTTSTVGNDAKMVNNGNLQPYIVTYIWKRIK